MCGLKSLNIRHLNSSYVSYPNGDLETALHVASRRSGHNSSMNKAVNERQLETLKLLLLFGADPRLKGRFTLAGKTLVGNAREFARERGNKNAVGVIETFM